MLDSILDTKLELKTTIICLLLSVAFGVITAILYKFFKKNQGYSIDLPLAIIILPVVVTGIVMVSRIIGINESASRTTLAFSFAGILAVARFRSTQHDISDLAFLSTVIILGFLNGLGYVAYSAILLIILTLIIVVITLTKFNAPSSKEMMLKIIVPESLNFDNIFDEILTKNCKSYYLKAVRSTEFGTMFEISYIVILKNDTNSHEFIDELRERNGNLNISLSVRRFNSMQQ